MRCAIFTLLIAFVACDPHTGAPIPSSESTLSLALEEPSPSIYPLRLTLRDQDDHAVGLDVFRGHPTIVSLFYGSCPMACPLLVTRVKQVEAALSPEVRDQTRVLLVSFDPERDTPAALREMASRHRADPTRWELATGPDDEVRQLAAALHSSYRKLSSGAFAHDSVITVIDGDGRTVERVEGPTADVAPLVAAVARVARRR